MGFHPLWTDIAQSHQICTSESGEKEKYRYQEGITKPDGIRLALFALKTIPFICIEPLDGYRFEVSQVLKYE